MPQTGTKTSWKTQAWIQMPPPFMHIWLDGSKQPIHHNYCHLWQIYESGVAWCSQYHKALTKFSPFFAKVIKRANQLLFNTESFLKLMIFHRFSAWQTHMVWTSVSLANHEWWFPNTHICIKCDKIFSITNQLNMNNLTSKDNSKKCAYFHSIRTSTSLLQPALHSRYFSKYTHKISWFNWLFAI